MAYGAFTRPGLTVIEIPPPDAERSFAIGRGCIRVTASGVGFLRLSGGAGRARVDVVRVQVRGWLEQTFFVPLDHRMDLVLLTLRGAARQTVYLPRRCPAPAVSPVVAALRPVGARPQVVAASLPVVISPRAPSAKAALHHVALAPPLSRARVAASSVSGSLRAERWSPSVRLDLLTMNPPEAER